MRISALTRSSAGLLLLATIGMAWSLYWGLEQLKKPFRLNESYFGTVELVSVQSRLLVDDYLRSGDASALQKAQDFLAGELDDSVGELPEALQEAIRPAVGELQQSLEVDLRAAGKLAGNIQGLLLNNELELMGAVGNLQDYVDEARGSAASGRVGAFQTQLSRLSRLAARRAVIRSRYFSAPSAPLQQQLAEISEEIEGLASRINELPLLGVEAEAEEDDFAALMGLDAAESETQAGADAGDQLTDELVYVAQRYLPELDNTVAQVERGQQARSRVEGLMAGLERRVRDSKHLIDQERSRIESLVIGLLGGFVVLLLLVAMATALLQFRVLAGMGQVSDYIRRLSAGDFSEPMDNTMGFKELHALVDCANQMQGYLCQLVREVRQEVTRVQSVSVSVDRFAEEINTSINCQHERTEDVNRAMAELVASFRLVAGHAVEASGSAEQGQQAVDLSAGVMTNLTESIRLLSDEVSQGAQMIELLKEESQNIESVLNVIVAIAEQTNLLALNAAIEAARAGDHGRGFAVVADEVRQLAQRTAESTQEIRQMIDGLQQSSDQVVTAMSRQQQQAETSVVRASEAGDSLRQVVEAIAQINSMNTLIAQATEEQSCSADSVKESVAGVQELSRVTADKAAEARQQSESLARVCDGLSQLVARYVV